MCLYAISSIMGCLQSSVLAPVRALGPLSTRLIPKGFKLRREISVAGWDAKEDSIESLELGGVVEGGYVGGLGRSVHLGEDILRESLGDLEEGGITASLLDALQLSIGL